VPRWPVAGATPIDASVRYISIWDSIRDVEDISNKLGRHSLTTEAEMGLPTMHDKVTATTRNCGHQDRLSSLPPPPTWSSCSGDPPPPPDRALTPSEGGSGDYSWWLPSLFLSGRLICMALVPRDVIRWARGARHSGFIYRSLIPTTPASKWEGLLRISRRGSLRPPWARRRTESWPIGPTRQRPGVRCRKRPWQARVTASAAGLRARWRG
jgi:hypothetical protein